MNTAFNTSQRVRDHTTDNKNEGNNENLFYNYKSWSEIFDFQNCFHCH